VAFDFNLSDAIAILLNGVEIPGFADLPSFDPSHFVEYSRGLTALNFLVSFVKPAVNKIGDFLSCCEKTDGIANIPIWELLRINNSGNDENDKSELLREHVNIATKLAASASGREYTPVFSANPSTAPSEDLSAADVIRQAVQDAAGSKGSETMEPSAMNQGVWDRTSVSGTALRHQVETHLVLTAADAKAKGFSPTDLTASGKFTVEDVKTNFVSGELKDSGSTAKQLKLEMGYTAKELVNDNYTVAELKDAFTAEELKSLLGELKDSGYTAKELKLEIGCTAKELLNGNYTLAELKDAFTKEELKSLLGELKDRGYKADQLKLEIGCTAKELLNSNFKLDDLELEL